uniref:SnoaL-like domain-containing protein n=1 Tax=Oryza nivara TaxID=4536 RepID=A0A0E0IH38_ORYNI
MALIHHHLAVPVAPAPPPRGHGPATAARRLTRHRPRCRSGAAAGARGRTMMAVIASSMVEPASGEETAARSAADVVRAFYDGVNRRDLAAVEPLIAEGCVYEDLVFPNAFVGRAEILGFFAGFMGSVSSDLRFVIDDISAGDDSRAVGVTWHLDWKGRPFPFSRGCSFYRLQLDEKQQQLQIVYGRDCVEPAVKPGESALLIIRAVTWIFERFPRLANMLETCAHIFLSCRYTQQVCATVRGRLGLSSTTPSADLSSWWRSARKSISKQDRKTFDAGDLGDLKERNARIFDNKAIPAAHLCAAMEDEWTSWGAAGLLCPLQAGSNLMAREQH